MILGRLIAIGLAWTSLAASAHAAELQVRDAWARATPPGAGVAAVLPRTEVESQVMGEASDTVKEQAQSLISDQLQEETVASLSGAGIDVEVEDLFDLSLLQEVYEENPDLVDHAG